MHGKNCAQHIFAAIIKQKYRNLENNYYFVDETITSGWIEIDQRDGIIISQWTFKSAIG